MAAIRVQHGNPTPAEVAALVVALTPAPAPADPATDGTGRPSVPAWTHAALLEGVGGPTVHTRADLPATGVPNVGV